jgi:hypothetical protein
VARAFLRPLTLVLLPLLIPSAAMAQIIVQPQPLAQPQPKEQGKIELRAEGSEFFRALLKIRGIQPVKEADLSTLNNYNDVIVIIVGDPKTRITNRGLSGQFILHTPSGIVENASRSGAAILVATTTNYHLPSHPNFGQIHVEEVPMSYVGEELNATLGNRYRDCPLLVPAPHRFNINGNDADLLKLFDGDGKDSKRLTRVAAGSPTYISLTFDDQQNAGLTPLALFPPGCSDETNRLKGNIVFAAGGEVRILKNSPTPFRIVAFASNKIFSNALLYLAAAENPEDQTDNMELCLRTIEYLQGPGLQRKRCVFFENGRLIEHFDDLARATNKQIPMPSANIGALQKDLIDKGNSLIDGFQKDDAPNKLANKLLPLRTLALIVFWFVSISACLFMLRRVFGSGKPSNIPPAPTIAGATADPPGVFDRRQKELLRRNNVYEPVRDLIREFFESVGIHGEPGEKLPKLKISDVVRKPDSLRLAIKDLWRLAYGQPQVVSIALWRDQEPYFERVREAHAQGKWAFVLESALTH